MRVKHLRWHLHEHQLQKHDDLHYGLNIFIDIQTSKTLIQMDINKMMKMEFIQ